ncbi:MAG: hypothetical protein V4548_05350 [Bacteroidota bacterium]
MKILVHLFMISTLLFAGVNNSNNTSKAIKVYTNQEEQKIVYLFFKIKKNGPTSNEITLYKTKTVKGKLKSLSPFIPENVKNGDLIITLTDNEGNEIIKHNAKNPLYPEFESFGEKIERYNMTLDENEFNFRFSYSEKIKNIKIEQLINSEKQILFIQKL